MFVSFKRSEIYLFLISKFIKKRKAPLSTPGVYTSSQSQHKKKRKKPKKTPRGPSPRYISFAREGDQIPVLELRHQGNNEDLPNF
jgi:hypothetical protein